MYLHPLSRRTPALLPHIPYHRHHRWERQDGDEVGSLGWRPRLWRPFLWPSKFSGQSDYVLRRSRRGRCEFEAVSGRAREGRREWALTQELKTFNPTNFLFRRRRLPPPPSLLLSFPMRQHDRAIERTEYRALARPPLLALPRVPSSIAREGEGGWLAGWLAAARGCS